MGKKVRKWEKREWEKDLDNYYLEKQITPSNSQQRRPMNFSYLNFLVESRLRDDAVDIVRGKYPSHARETGT